MSDEIRDRALGALFGQATGDALGTTVEFCQPQEAARELLPGPLLVVGGGTFRVLPGQITDDTELALALARSLARRGRYDPDDVANAYVRWFWSDPIDCGGTIGRAFGLPEGRPVRATQVRARATGSSQANGALMRIAPLAVFGWCLDRDALADLARADAKLSHPNPVCLAANVLFTRLVASAIQTGLSPAALVEDVVAWARDRADCAAALDIVQAGRGAPPADYYSQMGWVRIALQNAVFQLLHAADVREGVEDTVRQGGDADTNGAIAGALLGAVHGAEAIPDQWRAAVAGCTPDRPDEYHCGDLPDLTDALLRAGAAAAAP